MSSHLFGLVTSAGCLLTIAGCGSSAPDLAPVSGRITLNGEPLSGAIINFQPVATQSISVGVGSNARSDEAGLYNLKTIDAKPGALIGMHQVRIFSYSPESPIAEDTDKGPTQDRVPLRYNYQSTLTFTVPVTGIDQADFVLTSP